MGDKSQYTNVISHNEPRLPRVTRAEGTKHAIPKCTVLHYKSTVLLSWFSPTKLACEQLEISISYP